MAFRLCRTSSASLSASLTTATQVLLATNVSFRPLQPLKSTHPWTGDRAMWQLELARELARGWGAVRLSSPSDSWDLSVSVGPLMS